MNPISLSLPFLFAAGVSCASALAAQKTAPPTPTPKRSPAPRAQVPADCPHYWNRLRGLHDRYEDKHDRAAGQELLRVLPTGKTLPPEGCTERDVALSTLERDPSFRADELKRGDALAFQLSFRLMNIADGDYAESLDQDLGAAIRPYPSRFLKHLRAEHGDAFCDEGLVGNTSEDDAGAQALELAARAQALSSVRDRELAHARDVCLGVIGRLQARNARHADSEKPRARPSAAPSPEAEPEPTSTIPAAAAPAPDTEAPPAGPPSGPEDGGE